MHFLDIHDAHLKCAFNSHSWSLDIPASVRPKKIGLECKIKVDFMLLGRKLCCLDVFALVTDSIPR